MTLALIGATALYLMYGWLLCSIIASYLSGRKGYGEKIGLASGFILTILGVIIWLVWPAKAESDWKVVGPFGRGKTASADAARAAKGAGPTQGTGARAG